MAALRRLDPERAHDLALGALSLGFAGGNGPVRSDRLRTRVFGLDFPNPVGTAAGFDKNGVAIRETLRTGFGFVETGAVTPRPQPGNPKPRLFRLEEDGAIINRFGFNNDGAAALAGRLAKARGAGLVGVNLGANRNSDDRAEDFVAGLTLLYPHADFFTVNVSSPNTENLRNLQARAALENLLARVMSARNARFRAQGDGLRRPVLVKISPDLSDAEIADVAEAALTVGIDGIVATNTTLSRDGLHSRHASESGGLSGAPLKARALMVLKRLRRETGGKIPLIGVGGIATSEDAYERIRAGASLIQIYSAMVHEGIVLGRRIAKGLDRLMDRDGVREISDAVGGG